MNTRIFRAPLSRRSAIRLAVCALAAPAVSLLPSGLRSLVAAAAPPRPQQTGAPDIPAGSVIEPDQLAALLSHPGEKPVVICVGFKFLYDSAHIPGALYLGPAREAGGIASLEKWARSAPRNETVVLYCGCCPWAKCPNMLPAYAALKKMGFTQLRALRINQNFGADWVDKGFPTDKG